MPSGLFALLDDIATIAKVAAASIDDIGAAASKAGVKAAGVVVDDTAVTPRYVTGFTPDRELPIIWRITKGSLFNKLVLILPALLLLSTFVPWAITPLLMLGGAYLCFEGAEKVLHSLQEDKTSLAEDAEIVADKDHEETMVKGAVRTDFILSAEIMVIALNEVLDEHLVMRGATLALVARALAARRNRYSYRFLFAPGTIGARTPKAFMKLICAPAPWVAASCASAISAASGPP